MDIVCVFVCLYDVFFLANMNDVGVRVLSLKWRIEVVMVAEMYIGLFGE